MRMSIQTVFSRVRYLLAFVVMLWSAAAAGQYSITTADEFVSRPVINMYSSPSLDSEVVSQALYGTGVLSMEKKGEWIHIRTADEYTGWVAAADVTAGHGNYALGENAVRITELSANLYREPSVSDHAPVLNLPWEARLEVLPGKVDDSGRWLQVRLVNGQTAYVEQGNVSAKSPRLSIDQTIELARKFLGITYTWGGISSYGYDCSGFTQMLVRQRGIIMPRDANIQAKWSGVAPVERKDLKPGDLLFFGASPDHITHTGMYLGGGEFIHDTTHVHPAVQISKLNDMPWTKLLVAARRVK
jgi:gamma-D-glutamyl-L-lysine dipeptidyl-peptidase